MGQFGRILGVGVIMELSRRDDLTRPEALATTTVPVTQLAEELAPGRTLGARYRITSLLGRGGMGEVWQAYDLKLQVDVALKSIRAERFPGDQGIELLRREVRAAREVLSPNVCRIFDLVDQDGREFVSMEYIDGLTLLQILRDRGPLDLSEATRIASQFLAGLEAIHRAGLVHRDVKPENIMVTRTGRVVLMDFGVAKGVAEDARGTIAGTPAYMAPEQLQGQALDARADIFGAGVVLAEMIAPEGVRDRDSRESVWALVRQEPPRLFDGPWRAVLERAVAGDRERRYASARQLARALEEVTLRVEGAEDKRPYPGLESFKEADAEFFFGREVEVEAVWKKLQRANLLAIIGPSGAGKTSFVQAGLIRARPADWRHVACRPGAAPFAALAQALVGDLAGDADGMRLLLQIENPEQALAVTGRWRAKHPRALLVVDQFEELFTLCPSEVQAKFADLLGRLAAEADVHVLLVLRDDFLVRCQEHPRLAPIASDLTILLPPTGGSLRRALVQPALLCGYRLEDESLADEMLAAIEGERGALPLLAFAAARLWEHRDRERGLLTREAYDRIGRVSGALAQHAEATLERIGADRQPVVREIFRNLVTAQGTRATTEVDELLSVFPDREAASSVLRQLVDARLLTSFELPASPEGERARHRVEIVHESLLTSWPRLVRWQVQDTEGALLRDQLRQQARLWEERKRPDDLLWTGSSYQEFAVWRERYPGGLTAVEEAFAQAMVARAERLRRRRRVVLTGAFAALVAVVLVIGWYARGERTARLHSEATKLRAVGRTELAKDPSAALAYAIASLELVDHPEGRKFAIEALSRGPTALFAGPEQAVFQTSNLQFSRDGERLILGGTHGVKVMYRDGSPPTVLEDFIPDPIASRKVAIAPDGDPVVWSAGSDWTRIRMWSLAEGEEIRSLQMPGYTLPYASRDEFLLLTFLQPANMLLTQLCSPEDPEPRFLSRASLDRLGQLSLSAVDSERRRLISAKGRRLFIRPVEELDSGHERLLAEHTREIKNFTFEPMLGRVAAADSSGEIRLWSVRDEAVSLLRVIPGKQPVASIQLDPSGARLAAAVDSSEKRVRLWELEGPIEADPLVLLGSTLIPWGVSAFDPTGQWVVVAAQSDLMFYPLTHTYPYVLRGEGGSGTVGPLFTPDGESLVCGYPGEGIRVWSLNGKPVRDLPRPGAAGGAFNMAMDPGGQSILVGTLAAGAYLVSLEDGLASPLPDISPGGDFNYAAVFHPDRKTAIAIRGEGENPGIRVWDLEAMTVRVLDTPDALDLAMSANGTLFSGHKDGRILRWNLDDGTSVQVSQGKGQIWWLRVTPDARFLVSLSAPRGSIGGVSNIWTADLELHDVSLGTVRLLSGHGNQVFHLALDPAGTRLVTTDVNGITRVGPLLGDEEEPHIFMEREEGGIVTVSPDGNWIATSRGYTEPTLYLRPMPTGRPFHALPRREFLERLRALTNLRVVADEQSADGYRLDAVPFPGWEKVPTW